MVTQMELNRNTDKFVPYAGFGMFRPGNGLFCRFEACLCYCVILLILGGCTSTPKCVDYVPEHCKKYIPGQFVTYESYLKTLEQ